MGSRRRLLWETLGALHARGLTVTREGKEPITAIAPLPADFLALGFSDADLGG